MVNGKLPWEDGYEEPTTPINEKTPRFEYQKRLIKDAWERFRETPVVDWPWVVIACVVGAIAAVLIPVFVWATFFRTTPQEAFIGEMRWERQIEIEQFMTVKERAWRGEEPSDARVYDTNWEVHHYDTEWYPCTKTRTVYYTDSQGRSQSRTETYIDTCSRQVPVYRTRLYYEVDRWRTHRWVTANGTEIAPHWPALPTTLNRDAVLGNEREGDERREHYEMDVKCGKCKPGSHVEIKGSEWTTYRPGTKVTAFVNSKGTVRGIQIQGATT